MNKLNKTAYMLLLWALICLSGCAPKGSTKMYLDAKVQTEETHEKKKSGNKETAQQTVSDENGGADAAQSGSCFVYVCGAVNRPGVFELKTGSRVYEAIALAGGLRKDAYSKGLNQAAQIKDGDMIEVLTKKSIKSRQKKQKLLWNLKRSFRTV